MANEKPITKRIPVIFDTDIGTDIDDTWALGLLLLHPELDIKLVLTDSIDTVYRAKIAAKFLEKAGRSDVPVGIGPRFADRADGQRKWVEDYDLASYPGEVYEDGIGKMIDIINSSPEPVTIIAIGPVPNIKAALERDPGIVKNAKIIGMQGSVYFGYGRGAQCAEYNIVQDIPASKAMFAAPWQNIEITPLDTCDLIRLDGQRYQKLLENRDKTIVGMILENYEFWCKDQNPDNKAYETHSSTLFDTVAVYMAFTHDNLRFERLPIRVDDEGYTRIIDSVEPNVDAAVEWEDLDRYLDFLTDDLCR